MVPVLSLPEFTGSFATFTHISGVLGWNLGYFTWVANQAPDYFGRPDHMLQEKHLL